MRTPKTSWLQGTLSKKRSSKSLHTRTETKVHPSVNKFQNKTYHTNSPAAQGYVNAALSIKIQAAQSHAKPINTPKLTTGRFIALQREEIQLHPAENRFKLPYPGNLDKPLVQPHPQGTTSTIKRNHKLPAYRKATPNTEI